MYVHHPSIIFQLTVCSVSFLVKTKFLDFAFVSEFCLLSLCQRIGDIIASAVQQFSYGGALESFQKIQTFLNFFRKFTCCRPQILQPLYHIVNDIHTHTLMWCRNLGMFLFEYNLQTPLN